MEHSRSLVHKKIRFKQRTLTLLQPPHFPKTKKRMAHSLSLADIGSKYKVIVAHKGHIAVDPLGADNCLFEAPVILSSGCIPDGSWKYLYQPLAGDHGFMVVKSDVCGEFACIFRVYLHHGLKLCVWGRGHIDMDVIGSGRNDDIQRAQSFVSPRDLRIHTWSYDMNLVKAAFAELWPGYRVASLSPELLDNLRSHRAEHIDAMLDVAGGIQDIRDVVLSFLPEWIPPTWLGRSDEEHQLAREDLDYGVYLVTAALHWLNLDAGDGPRAAAAVPAGGA